MSGHGHHHARTAHRPLAADVRDTNLPGSLRSRPRAWPSRPRAAGFALRHPGRSAVNRCRLACWRRGSRHPPQCCGGSLPPPYGQACRPLRCGHGSLPRARCGTLDQTRGCLRSGDGRDTRPRRAGYSEADCLPGPGCSGTRRSRKPGCSEVRCFRRLGWSLVVRLRRPGESSRGSRHPRVPTEHGDPDPSWYPSARHRRPAYGCYGPPGSWRASGNRPRPAVPGHSCQRAWRSSKPSGSRYLLPGSSASRIPRPRSSTSSFNTTQTSEEGRSTTSGATLFKHVRRRPTLPRGPPRSTIGAEGLNFRVRNGTGCFPFAITAVTLLRCHQQKLC